MLNNVAKTRSQRDTQTFKDSACLEEHYGQMIPAVSYQLKLDFPLNVLKCSKPGVVTHSDSMEAAHCSYFPLKSFSLFYFLLTTKMTSVHHKNTVNTRKKHHSKSHRSQHSPANILVCFLSEALVCLLFIAPNMEANF